MKLTIAALVACIVLLSSPWSSADPKPSFSETFSKTALALKGNPTDMRYETAEERAIRVAWAAAVMYDAADEATCGGGSREPGWKDCRRTWHGRRSELALALLGVAYHESGLAAYVGLGRCEEGPKGSRCDNGKARTYLQVHRETCPEVWEYEPGSEREFVFAARCAVRVFNASARICSDFDDHWRVVRRASWSEVFAKYAGQTCGSSIGVALELSKITVEQLFRKQ